MIFKLNQVRQDKEPRGSFPELHDHVVHPISFFPASFAKITYSIPHKASHYCQNA